MLLLNRKKHFDLKKYFNFSAVTHFEGLEKKKVDGQSSWTSARTSLALFYSRV
jgi:hypothetical protein